MWLGVFCDVWLWNSGVVSGVLFWAWVCVVFDGLLGLFLRYGWYLVVACWCRFIRISGCFGAGLYC